MEKYRLPNKDNPALQIDPNFLEGGISKCIEIRHKQIEITSLNMEYSKIFDIDFNLFNYITFIEKLSFSSYLKLKNNADITALYNLQNLKELSFHQQVFKFDFKFFQKLEKLFFTYNKSLTNFEKLHKLKSIFITSFNEKKICKLSENTSTEFLRFDKGNFLTLQGIESMSNLKELQINYNSKCNDVSSINKLRQLRVLHIEKCKNLNDLSILQDNEQIVEIFISNVKSLKFVTGMKSLKKIRFWNVEDGDLTPLLKSKSIEKVDFHPNKKNYSHTHEQINTLLNRK